MLHRAWYEPMVMKKQITNSFTTAEAQDSNTVRRLVLTVSAAAHCSRCVVWVG